MRDTVIARLELIWPAVAAAGATFLGIGSCVLSARIIPAHSRAELISPLIGVVVIGIGFRPIVRYVPPARTRGDRLTSFVLAVVTSWIITGWAVRYSWAHAGGGPNAHAGTAEELMVQLAEIFVGLIVASIIAMLVAAYFVAFRQDSARDRSRSARAAP